MRHRISTRGSAYAAIRANPQGVVEHNRLQESKSKAREKALENKKGDNKSYSLHVHHRGKTKFSSTPGITTPIKGSNKMKWTNHLRGHELDKS